MFRRKPSKDEEYVKMREALYRFLWAETHKPEPYFDNNGDIQLRRGAPMPDIDLNQSNGRDAYIRRELKKLLG